MAPLKPIKLSIYILISIVLLFTLTCDIYNKSIPEYLDKYTNTATVSDHFTTGGMLINQQGLPHANLILPGSEITLRLRNPKNYEILTHLDYFDGGSWIPFSRYEVSGDYSTVENTSAVFPGTTFTLKYDPTTQIRMTINNAEIGQSYKLRVRLQDRETKREFEPYVMPLIECTHYPEPVGLMTVRAGASNIGVIVDWQQVLRSGTTIGSHADANRLVISCSDLGVSQTYTRVLNEVTSLWGPWSPAGINEAGSPFFSIELGAGIPLVEGRSYNVVLRYSNKAGIVTEISEALTAATMDARIMRGGLPNEYPNLQEAFDSMNTHGETSATIIVLRSIIDQAPINITGTKTITLESSGSNMIQLGSAHSGSSLFTVHSGLNLKLGGASSGPLTLKGVDPNTKALITVDSGGILTLDTGAVITGNKTNSITGGGISSAGNFTMSGGSVEGNSAGVGGGVYVTGTFTLTGGTIQNNSAGVGGGGVYVDGTLNMNNSTAQIKSNTANTSGGGIYFTGANLNMNSSTAVISDNTATNNDGGGIYVASGSLNLGSGTISGNTAANGGGIYFLGAGSITINSDNVKITGNRAIAGDGGGVYKAGNGTFTMSAGTIGGPTLQTRNSASGNGGGVVIAGGMFIIRDTAIIEGNNAGGNGGGVYFSSTGTLNMTSGAPEIRSNTASGDGGGLYIAAGSFTMSVGTIKGNTATFGGGVYKTGTGTFTQSGGNIESNTASTNGGGVNVDGGSMTMSGGVIYGTDVSPSSLANRATTGSGDSLNVVSGTAVYAMPYGIGNILPGSGLGSYTYTLPPYEATVTIGSTDTHYPTLVDAFDSIQNGQTATVTLRKFVMNFKYNITGTGKVITLVSDGDKDISIGSGGSIFTVPSTVTLILGTTGGTLTLQGSDANDAALITVNTGGNLTLNSNVRITENVHTIAAGGDGLGGGVYFAGTTFTMNGGAIVRSSAVYGAGVYMQSGTFNMNGGTIGGNSDLTRNTASQVGGGVYINNLATMTMSGTAVITGNRAINGGGVYYDGSFTMSGNAMIEGNTVTANGGGVYVAGTTMIMSNSATIESNTATANGGGVFMYDGKSLTMNNGAISSNSADYGAGVYIGEGGFFTKSDGSMTNNNATNKGGAVYIGDAASFTKSGGDIEANTAPNGAGVYVGFNSQFSIGGGSLNSNTATGNGGGVYVESDGSFIMSLAGRITVSTNNSNVGNNDVYLESGAVIGTVEIAATPTGKVARITPVTYSEAPPIQVLGGTPANISANSTRFEVTPYMGDSWFVNSTGFLYQPAIELTVNAVTTYPASLQAAFDGVGTTQTGTIKILRNIENQAPVTTVSGTKTINLVSPTTGATITIGTAGTLISLQSGVTLNVGGATSGQITLSGRGIGTGDPDNNNSLVVVNGGTLNLNDKAVIRDNKCSGNASGVHVLNGGQLTMSGNAVIRDNKSLGWGGGVRIDSNSSFNMSGGSVINNIAQEGGGVYFNGSTFSLSNGTISNNEAESGAGVYVNTGAFAIGNGGVVEGNAATSNIGGGVCLEAGTLEMNGTAAIKNNTAVGSGGGVYMLGGYFNMNSGTVGSNVAPSGAGVYVGNGTFTMINGTIEDNTASSTGAGVYMGGGNFEMRGGTIYGSSEAVGLRNTTTANTPISGPSLYVDSGATAKYGDALGGANILAAIPGGTNATLPNFDFEAEIGSTKYATLEDAIDSIGSSETGIISVLKDITVPSTITIAGMNRTITLENNSTPAKTISLGSDVKLFRVSGSGNTLKIQGNSVANTLTLSGRTYNIEALVEVVAGTFELSNNAIIVNNVNTTISGKGGGVFVDGGTFTLSGGTIRGCKTTGTGSTGGGVCVASGTFNITSGTIGGAVANESLTGGGVHVATGTVNMSNGTISGNIASRNGGGVHMTSGTFDMTGGAITDNEQTTANNTSGGAGVFTNTGAIFNLKTGTIGNNIAAGNGGGVFINGGTFTMEGGTITGNKSTGTSANNVNGGGGVYVSTYTGIFDMKNGTIEDNTAENSGGGVYVTGTGTAKMSGGYIYGSDGASYSPPGISNKVIGGTGASFHISSGGIAQYEGSYGSDLIIPGLGARDTDFTLPALDYEAIIGTVPYLTLQAAFTAAVNGDTVRVLKNIIVPATINVSGKEITLANNSSAPKEIALGVQGQLFTVSGSGKLTVSGISTISTLTLAGRSSNTGAFVRVDSTGTFELSNNAIIENNTNTTDFGTGGGVLVNGGAFTLSGGTIRECKVTGSNSIGGGVCVTAGTFNMSSGTIGGSAAVANEAVTGAGVHFAGTTFTMSGGTISDNSATGMVGCGGGVYISVGQMTMSGTASINNNDATYGGGVYVDNPGSYFIMSNGTISGNIAGAGGGVELESGGTMEMTGGTIQNNKATGIGGGVLVGDDGHLEMSGGTIQNNTSNIGAGGGLYVTDTGDLKMSAGARVTVSATSNDIFLGGTATSGAAIDISANFTGSDTVARITPSNYASTRRVLSGLVGNGNYQRFDVTSNGGQAWTIDSSGYLFQSSVEMIIGAGTPTYPSSLQDAFDSVGAGETATIKIISDITNQPAIPAISGNKIINLVSTGNRTITLASTGGSLLTIGNNTTLRIGDSSGVGGAASGQLTLNGRGLGVTNSASLIVVDTGGTLNIYNNAVIKDNRISGSGSGVLMDGTTLNMYGGIIENNQAAVSGNGGGGAVCVNSGTFNMYSGALIRGNQAGHAATTGGGGGVYVASGASFVMNGGTIDDNNAAGAGRGGGVFVNGGTFTMEDGMIGGLTAANRNRARSGGGVCVIGAGSFIMNGGTISQNTCTSWGGGVYAYVGTFNMNNGTISGNVSEEAGGGVFLLEAHFNMYDGKIQGNSAWWGGGVYVGGDTVASRATFTMNGGNIYGIDASPLSLANTADEEGASLYVEPEGIAQYGPMLGGGGIYLPYDDEGWRFTNDTLPN